MDVTGPMVAIALAGVIAHEAHEWRAALRPGHVEKLVLDRHYSAGTPTLQVTADIDKDGKAYEVVLTPSLKLTPTLKSLRFRTPRRARRPPKTPRFRTSRCVAAQYDADEAVERALAYALAAAAEEKRWDVVVELSRQLETRREKERSDE